MTQYKLFFEKMVSENKELFDNFSDIHREYMLDPHKWQKLFNEYGGEVVEIICDYERKLCATSEKGQFGKFSTTLSTRFWAEVKKVFPKIELVGVKIIN